MTRPTAAQSSLSHWRTLRFSMRPHSTGQTSTIGRSQMTMPPGVDAEVSREALDLLRQVDHRLGDVVVLGVGEAVAVGLLRPGVERALGVAQGLAHVPDR